jgi:hypothetical protein
MPPTVETVLICSNFGGLGTFWYVQLPSEDESLNGTNLPAGMASLAPPCPQFVCVGIRRLSRKRQRKKLQPRVRQASDCGSHADTWSLSMHELAAVEVVQALYMPSKAL